VEELVICGTHTAQGRYIKVWNVFFMVHSWVNWWSGGYRKPESGHRLLENVIRHVGGENVFSVSEIVMQRFGKIIPEVVEQRRVPDWKITRLPDLIP